MESSHARMGAREFWVLGTLCFLALALLPAWGFGWDTLAPDAEGDRGQLRYVADSVMDQLTSSYLLPTLGFCLVLRCRRVDLSVWAVTGLGGALAAVCLRRGLPIPAAFAASILAGAAVGVLNGLVAARWRWGCLLTLATGAGALWAAQGLAPGQPDPNTAPVLPPLGRMLLVALAYSLTMILLVGWESLSRRRRLPGPGRWQIVVAMAACGALSATGGICWLAEHSRAPLPTWVIGDLRIPTAALLTGAVLLSGPRRTLLAGLLLPTTLLLTVIWRQEVHGLQALHARGFEYQMVLLAAMAAWGQWSIRKVIRENHPRRRIAMICLIGGSLGIVLVALQVGHSIETQRTLHVFGVAIWLLFAVGAVASLALGARRCGEKLPAGE